MIHYSFILNSDQSLTSYFLKEYLKSFQILENPINYFYYYLNECLNGFYFVHHHHYHLIIIFIISIYYYYVSKLSLLCHNNQNLQTMTIHYFYYLYYFNLLPLANFHSYIQYHVLKITIIINTNLTFISTYQDFKMHSFNPNQAYFHYIFKVMIYKFKDSNSQIQIPWSLQANYLNSF